MNSKIYLSAALIIGIVILLNLLANEYHVRVDLTDDKQFTLSKATRDILDDLEEPVTIKAYFSKNLPPNVEKTREDFRDLLVEYATASDGQIVYEFVNPNEKEDYEKEATENGIRPVLINVREKDQVKQQKAFLGATLSLGDKKDVIPFVQPGAAMEYALSSAIKKITIDKKPKVGFVTGHGTASPADMVEVNQQLSILYEPVAVPLNDSSGIPDDIKTLALIRPTDSIKSDLLSKVDQFLQRGGRLLVALNRVGGDFRSLSGHPINTGLDEWLRKKGVEVANNFIIDANCGSVSVPQQLGIFTVQANVSFPYVPVISTFADHPVTSGLESVMLEFASEVKPTGDSTTTFIPLAFSSEKANALNAPQFFDINKQWTEDDFPRERIVVAAALERRTGDQTFKMIVVGDGDFPVNGPPQQQKRLQPDNISFMANAIDWLSDDTGLIELRTRGAVSRPLREVDDSTKVFLKYLNFLLPIALVVLYGIARAQRNRIKRMRLMTETF